MSAYPQIVNENGTWNWTGSRDLFGATVNPPKGTVGYPDNTTVGLRNAAAFDSLLGGPAAMACQKVYLQEGELPTAVPANWVAAAQAGVRLIVCVKPPQALTSANEAAYAAFISALIAQLPAGSWELVNWQEPNTAHNGKPSFPSVSAYQAFAAFYGNVARQLAPGVPLIYDPALCGAKDACNLASVVAYFPGRDYCDKWLLDYYMSAALRGTPVTESLQAVAAVADPLGIPVGIGEFNAAASQLVFTEPPWERFCDALIDFFSGRLAAGLDNAHICFWMGEQSHTDDLITTSADPKLPGLQRMYRALAP